MGCSFSYNVSPIQKVRGIVYRVNDGLVEYLLLQRHSGTWQFPQGKVEPEEDSIDALLREIGEETGLPILSVSDTADRSVYTDKRSNRIALESYAVEVPMGEVAVIGDEHQDMEWVKPSEVPDYLAKHPEQVEVLRQVHQMRGREMSESTLSLVESDFLDSFLA